MLLEHGILWTRLMSNLQGFFQFIEPKEIITYIIRWLREDNKWSPDLAMEKAMVNSLSLALRRGNQNPENGLTTIMPLANDKEKTTGFMSSESKIKIL